MDWATLVGGAATVASVTSFTPQAWKVIKTRDTTSISLKMYVITVIGFSLWLIYGFMLGAWPLIVTNGLCLAISAFILTMKLLPEKEKAKLAGQLDVLGPKSRT